MFFQLNFVDFYEDFDSEIEIDVFKFNKFSVKIIFLKNVFFKLKRVVKLVLFIQQRKITIFKIKFKFLEFDFEDEEENEKFMLSIVDIKVCWYCRMQLLFEFNFCVFIILKVFWLYRLF